MYHLIRQWPAKWDIQTHAITILLLSLIWHYKIVNTSLTKPSSLSTRTKISAERRHRWGRRRRRLEILRDRKASTVPRCHHRSQTRDPIPRPLERPLSSGRYVVPRQLLMQNASQLVIVKDFERWGQSWQVTCDSLCCCHIRQSSNADRDDKPYRNRWISSEDCN